MFALLHFAVAIVSRGLNYYDDIPLTILTITMVIVVSMRNNTRVEMMAVLTLVATLLGFIFGSWLWEPLMLIVKSSYLAPAISTFLITTILGLAIDRITLRVKRLRSNHNEHSIKPQNIIIIAIVGLIVGCAVGYIWKAKKRGVKCIGCPDAKSCSGNCSGCSCSCGANSPKK